MPESVTVVLGVSLNWLSPTEGNLLAPTVLFSGEETTQDQQF